ncbi:MAG: UDP-3-O-acyl-N-acetylglucosamine deacetylase [Candidatus Omnitrophota bacterium]
MNRGNKKTIGKEVFFSGRALQTGQEVSVTCKPAGSNAGIVFRRMDLEDKPEIMLMSAAFSDAGQRRSVISEGSASVQTVEHFLAALWGLGVDNILVELHGGELPAMDGSALEFIEQLREAGLSEQAEPREFIEITEPEEIRAGDSSITILPEKEFRVSYLIDYKVRSIGHQVFDISLDGSSFEKEIAPARTFCLKEEAEALLKAGLGQGATLENTLVMGEDGPVGTTLRFPDEPVRHKILDLVGDFYLLGRPVLCRVVAERSGHRLNAMMAKRIYEKYIRKGACL